MGRITVSGVGVDVASVAAKQVPLDDMSDLVAFPGQPFDMWGRRTYDLLKLEPGSLNIRAFIAAYKTENAEFAWILRIGSLIVLCGAFNCIFKPLSVAADLVKMLNYCTCCLGDILDGAAQSVISTVSCCFAIFCFLMVFSAAWAVANPTFLAVFGLWVVGCLCAGIAFKALAGKQTNAREAYVHIDHLKICSTSAPSFATIAV